MRGKVWIDGAVVEASAARVSAFDRGFLYGDAAFETMRVYGGVPFAVDAHLARLARAAEHLLFPAPVDLVRVRSALAQTLAAAALAEAYARVVVSRGVGAPGLARAGAQGGLYVYVLELSTGAPSDEAYRVGRAAMVVDSGVEVTGAAEPVLKTLSYVRSVVATERARRAGAEEAILVAADRVHVSEGASANLFAYLNGVWVTPHVETGLLPGITRSTLLELLRANGMPCEERWLRRDELTHVGELALTSSLREVMPIVRLDGQPVGAGVPGEATRKLHALYRAEVARQCGA